MKLLRRPGLAWPVKNLGLGLIGDCADFVPFASAVFEIDTDIASASVGLVQAGSQLAATSFFKVAASCDPAWASQTEIGNKNDSLKEAVFQCQYQIFNSPGLSWGENLGLALNNGGLNHRVGNS